MISIGTFLLLAFGGLFWLKANATIACGTWNIVPGPSLGFFDDHIFKFGSSLTGAVALSANDIWAVGDKSVFNGAQPLIVHWDGSNWSRVPSPNLNVEEGYLSDVAAVSPDDIWAVGYTLVPGPGIVVLRWDGKRWSEAPKPAANGNLYAVDAISKDDIWAVGWSYGSDYYQDPLIVHWDGKQWTVMPNINLGNSAEDFGLYDVKAVSPNDVWAVGLGVILHWDGASWDVVPNRVSCKGKANVVSLSALSSTDIWAAGSCHYGSAVDWDRQPLIEHWDGKSWTKVSSATPLKNEVLGKLTAVSSNDIWAVGNEGAYLDSKFVLEHWDGARWSVTSALQVNNPPSYSGSIIAVSKDELWALGSSEEREFFARYVACPAATNNDSKLP